MQKIGKELLPVKEEALPHALNVMRKSRAITLTH